MSADLKKDGFQVVRGVLDTACVDALRDEFERLAPAFASSRNGTAFGMRGVMALSDHVRSLARSNQIVRLVSAVIGSGATPVRSIFFDKTPDANWPLPWHQDRVIALASRHEIDGFCNWTVKGGVDHAEPPVALLQSIATVRLHLDPCDEENGALQVVRGHQDTLLDAVRLAGFRNSDLVNTLSVEAGDAVLMRPLTPHSSQKSISDRRRRVLHLEYCNTRLPEPLQWKEAA